MLCLISPGTAVRDCRKTTAGPPPPGLAGNRLTCSPATEAKRCSGPTSAMHSSPLPFYSRSSSCSCSCSDSPSADAVVGEAKSITSISCDCSRLAASRRMACIASWVRERRHSAVATTMLVPLLVLPLLLGFCFRPQGWFNQEPGTQDVRPQIAQIHADLDYRILSNK